MQQCFNTALNNLRYAQIVTKYAITVSAKHQLYSPYCTPLKFMKLQPVCTDYNLPPICAYTFHSKHNFCICEWILYDKLFNLLSRAIQLRFYVIFVLYPQTWLQRVHILLGKLLCNTGPDQTPCTYSEAITATRCHGAKFTS